MREDLRNDESLNPDSHPRDFRKSLGCDADDVEAALVKLQPRPSTINRERLMFLAGKAAGAAQRTLTPAKRGWAWPLATLASVAAMVVFAVLFGLERVRPRSSQTMVDRTPRRSVVMPNRPVAKSPERDIRAKPQAAPAGVAVDGRGSDSLAVESRMARSRHPVLMTDPDQLPNAAPSGGPGFVNPLSVGDTQRVLNGDLSATRGKPTPPSGFPSILNQFRFGRGGL
jgi:hypothetical protein